MGQGPRSGKMTRSWFSEAITIANASSISGSFLLAGRPIVGIVMPEVWTQASLTFDVNACAGGTFYPLTDDGGNVIRLSPSGSTAIANNTKLEKLSSWYGMRIRSGCGAASRVDQGAARTFVIFSQG